MPFSDDAKPHPNYYAAPELIDDTALPPYDEWFLGYAGFWIRFLAHFIDNVLVSALLFATVFGLGALVGLFQVATGHQEDTLSEEVAALIGLAFWVVYLLGLVGYYAGMESSPLQATLGKLAVGVKVTDLNGRRISFLRATGRFAGKLVSGMILYIGFIMAAFTERNQALHDMMAGTLVVKVR